MARESQRSRPPGDGPRLRLVCVNDVYLLDNLPRIATLLRHLDATDRVDATLTTLAGDFLAPSLLSSIDHGRGMMRCLNALPVTHLCFGNHDDDVGLTELLGRVAEFEGVWLNGNLPEFAADLPDRVVVAVPGPARTVRVGLVGVVSDNPHLYSGPPFGGGPMEPPDDAVCRLGRRLVEEEGCACVLPLTHQSLPRDRALAARSDAPPMPVIVGGHEHEVHLEEVGATWIVKAGADAFHAAVVELSWPAEPPAEGPDLPAVTVRLEAAVDHPEDPDMRALVDEIHVVLRDLEAAALMPIPPDVALSSEGTRVRQTSVGTLVCSRLRDALGADAAVCNGGGIRGDRVYRNRFTYGDLKTELPFPNEAVVVPMPGAVLAEVVAASRARAPVPSGAFLQVDDGMVVDEAHRIVEVAFAPFDPARTYQVVVIRVLLEGIDGIAPLTRYVAEHPERIPESDAGRDTKQALVESLAQCLWRSLGPFEGIDRNGDGRVDAEELAEAVTELFGEAVSPITVELLMRAADADGDGALTPADVAQAAGPDPEEIGSPVAQE